ncbi:hypothetical protein GCM10027290_04470 [Micromonospora sonneratiae]
MFTRGDEDKVITWLADEVCPSELNTDRQREAVLARCRSARLAEALCTGTAGGVKIGLRKSALWTTVPRPARQPRSGPCSSPTTSPTPTCAVRSTKGCRSSSSGTPPTP